MEYKFSIYEVAKILAKTYGISVTLEGDYINLQTMAKSHLYLFEDGTVKGRYNYESNVFDTAETLEDVVCNLAFEFENCLHGRTFYNTNWAILYDKVVGNWETVQKELVW